MGYQALLFCPDDKTARVVMQVLADLEFKVEAFREPFAAVKKLMAQHFDALIVDCDNEQNAALVFKSARNSESNQASLAVAVVEGQTGVAKAFRIGANLVLTKPINVEQSKGTLRVARGLLRKAETAKASLAASSSPTEMPTQQPAPAALSEEAKTQSSIREPAQKAVLDLPPQTLLEPPAASTSTFELEKEPVPKPDAAEAALLESMPDSVLASGTQSAEGAESSSLTKSSPWQLVPKPSETTAASVTPVADAGRKGEPEPAPVKAVASKGKAGSAAAAAPAKQAARSSRKPTEIKQAGHGTREAGVEEPWPQEPLPAEAEKEEQIFSSLAAKKQSTGSGSSRKVLVTVLVLAALAAAAYFGWMRLHPVNGQPAIQKQVPAALHDNPVAVPQAVVTPDSATETPVASATTEFQGSPAGVSAGTGPQSEEGSSAANAKPQATKPAAGIPATAPASNTAGVQAPEPIVVKNSGVQRPANAAPAQEAAEPPAAGAFAMASNPDDKAISGIMSTAAPSMPKPQPQTLKVSQGVSQGLLVKRVTPVYPPQARQRHLEGAVQLQANIAKDGSITAVKLVNGDALLGRAAIDAVRQWKYKPYYLNGEPIDIETQVTVNFKLP